MRRASWLAIALVTLTACGRTGFASGRLGAEDEADAAADGDGADGGAPDLGPRDLGPDLGPRDLGPDLGPRDIGPDIGPRDIGPDIGPRDFGPDTGPDIGPMCEDCSALDDDCNVGTCDRATGQCRRVPRPSGLRCDDGNACTIADRCLAGSCMGNEVECTGLTTPCTVGQCVPRTGACVAVPLRDGTPCDDGLMCTVADFCVQGTCASGPQASSCQSASVIPLAVGPQVLQSTGVCGTDQITNSCGRRSGVDAVWSFTADGPRVLRVVAQPPAPTASMAYESTCGQPATELLCARPLANTLTAQTLVQAGTTFVAIDPGNGTFPNGISTIEATVDPHDVCAGALPITLPPVGGQVEAAGMTLGAGDDFQGPCAGGANSPDHVYRLTVGATSQVRLALEPPPSGNFYDAALYVFAEPCAQGSVMALACDDDANGNLQPLIETTLAPGNYFVVVDGFSQNNAGEYALRITNLPLSASFTFPDVGDAILQQLPGQYSQDGDFVEGARRPALPVAGGAELNLAINNFLMCDQLEVLVSVNGVPITSMTILPGMVNLNIMATFPPIPGPNYSLRYEVQRDVAPNCGGVDLPLGVSTFQLLPP